MDFHGRIVRQFSGLPAFYQNRKSVGTILDRIHNQKAGLTSCCCVFRLPGRLRLFFRSILWHPSLAIPAIPRNVFKIAFPKDSISPARNRSDRSLRSEALLAGRAGNCQHSNFCERIGPGNEKNSLANAGGRVITEKNSLAKAGGRVITEKNSLAKAGGRVITEKNSLARAGGRVITESNSLARCRWTCHH